MKNKLLLIGALLFTGSVFAFGAFTLIDSAFNTSPKATSNMEYFDNNFEDTKASVAFKASYDNLNVRSWRMVNPYFDKKLLNTLLEVKDSKSVKVFTLNSPSRVVVDFMSANIKSSIKFPFNTEALKGIRVGRHSDKVRVVLDVRDHLDLKKAVEIRNLTANSALLTIVE